MEIEEDIEELKKLFYSDNLTQAGKRELINYYEEKIQELEEENRQTNEKIDKLVVKMRKNGTNYWADEWEKVKEMSKEFLGGER